MWLHMASSTLNFSDVCCRTRWINGCNEWSTDELPFASWRCPTHDITPLIFLKINSIANVYVNMFNITLLSNFLSYAIPPYYAAFGWSACDTVLTTSDSAFPPLNAVFGRVGGRELESVDSRKLCSVLHQSYATRLHGPRRWYEYRLFPRKLPANCR